MFIKKEIEMAGIASSHRVIDQDHLFLHTLRLNLENDYEAELSEQQILIVCDVFKKIIQNTSAYDQNEEIKRFSKKLSETDKKASSAFNWLVKERVEKYDPTNPIKIENPQPQGEKIPICSANHLVPSRQLEKVFYSRVNYEKPVQIKNQNLWLEGKRLKFVRVPSSKPPKDTMWIAEKTTGDRFVWRSEFQVDKFDLQKLMIFLLKDRETQMPSMHLNVGTHGDESGQGADIGNKRLVDLRIKEEAQQALALACKDAEIPFRFAKDKFSIHEVNTYSPNIYPTEADHIIDPQCKGAHTAILPGNGLDEPLMFLSREGSPAPRAASPCRYQGATVHTQRAQQAAQAAELPAISFGAAEWAKYFGDVGAEPPLPKDITQILKSSCPFFPGKKVEETHLLTLIPQTVNGKPFHLDALAELIKSPRTGHQTKCNIYISDVKKELGTKSFASHWALMTRDVIPDSRNKAYDKQKALVRRHAEESGISYELPTALEAATAILMHHVRSGEKLYSDEPLTYTRCIEKVDQDKWPAAIGGFASGGLAVSHDDHDYDRDC